MKKFACVQFNVKGKITTDIICRSWMVNRRLCYWPPARMQKDDVENMVKLQKPPQKFKWKKYKCTILCESSKSTCCKGFLHKSDRYANIIEWKSYRTFCCWSSETGYKVSTEVLSSFYFV